MFHESPASASEPVFNSLDDGGPLTQRRIRHITSIQIRNLTPFPVRDAFTTALSKPAEQPQFTSYGHLTDDQGTLSRKRQRKISTNSTATRRSFKREDGVYDEGFAASSSGERGRKISHSGISIRSNGSFGTSSGHQEQSSMASRSPRAARPARPRTSSMGSSLNLHLAGTPRAGSAVLASSSPDTAPLSALFPDNSQSGLEKVLKSRLIETFISIAIPKHAVDGPPRTNLPPEMPGSSSSTKSLHNGTRLKPTVASFPNISSVDSSSLLKNTSSKSTSASSRTKSTVARGPASSKSFSPSNGATKASSVLSAPTTSNPASNYSLASSESHTSNPDYFSLLHRPSINPTFPIDARPGRDFAEGTDVSGQQLMIQAWGKVPVQWQNEKLVVDTDKKGNSHECAGSEDKFSWKILERWDIDLDELIPLSDELAEHPSQLPSNSLVISLSPPGQLFYFPGHNSSSRSSTPSAGYTSDPETELRKAKQSGDHPMSSAGLETGYSLDIVPLSGRRRRKAQGNVSESKEYGSTASCSDLFKLVTLQCCIRDNHKSLSDIICQIDKMLEEDGTFSLRREISQREARVQELKANTRDVIEASKRTRDGIRRQAELLHLRATALSTARDQHDMQVASGMQAEQTLLIERSRLLSLRARFGPISVSLLSTLSFIFPIELYSPPDLLFTIIDVPLPIPLSSTDPAPPLTIPAHKSVNEDSVATALGYVVQVLQLLAAYVGKNLIYPVTCVGSRSLIRDGISAMVGPRMFPLFSKGVDTYRFEYGVFLLNKNIEMLMVERDLRALDMRHTLPNLKNLLLTLSHGESSQPHLSLRSPLVTMTELETPSPRKDSPTELNVSTPKRASDTDLPLENGTPPASGSTTPTVAAATDEPRKTRPFLGLAPFADFIRSRYPSSSRLSVKMDPDALEESSEGGEGVELDGDVEDEDDRKTIHGVAMPPHEAGQAGNEADDAGVDRRTPEPKREINGENFPSPLSVPTL